MDMSVSVKPPLNETLPMPEELAVRAWDCAYVLVQDYQDQLEGWDFEVMADAYRARPQGMTWFLAASVMALYIRVVDQRV